METHLVIPLQESFVSVSSC